MTFLDVQNMRQVGTPDLSSDGRWLLYTLSVPDWKEARRQSDIFIVSTDRGVSTTRQLTYTKDKTETQPRWSRDGSFFVFASDRDASARESAPGGSVARVKVADGLVRMPASLGGTQLGYYLGPGAAIVIPVKPLKPSTRYVASVTMKGNGVTLTHSWSFTTAK